MEYLTEEDLARIAAREERELISRDPVAYKRQLEIDPDWKSDPDQPLPDRFYAEAKRIAAVKGQKAATQWLVDEAHKVQMAKPVARPWRAFNRGEAVFMSVATKGTASAIALVFIYLVTDANNFAVATSFALVYVAFIAVAAAITSEVW